MRAVLLGLLSLFLLLALALAVVPGFIDWQAAKPRVEAQLSELVGRKIAIDGSLSLRLLPRPRVTADGLRLANRPNGSEPELLRIARLEMLVAPLPLLSGQVDVQSLRLVRPVLLLERLGDGSGNWQHAQAERGASGRDRLLRDVSLEAVEVRDGEVVWRDHRAGREERLSGIDALLTAESLRGPLSTQGRLLYRERELLFDIGVGAPTVQNRQAVRLQLALPQAAGAELRLSARLDESGGAWRAEGGLQLRAPDTEAFFRELGGDPLPGLRLNQALQVESAMGWDGGVLTLGNLEAALGDGARVSGQARLRPGVAPELDVEVSTRFLDLDSVVEPGEPLWPRLALPQGLTGDVTLDAERLRLRGGTLRGLRFGGRFEAGGLQVEAAKVQLPGGAELSLEGHWSLNPEGPGFDGSLAAQSTNLRAQLAWLGIDPVGVDSDRLRRFSLRTALKAEPGLITLSAATVNLDLARMTGGLAFAPRERVALGLRLSADRLNLDAYHDPAQLPERALLNRFDANLEVEADSLILGGRQMDELLVNATLRNGQLRLRDLRIGQVAGARLQAVGLLDELAAPVPHLVEGSLELEAKDSRRLLDELDLPAPGLLRRLGPFTLTGLISGSDEGADLNLDIAAQDAAALLTARLDGWGESLRIAEGRLDVQGLPAESGARLLGFKTAAWHEELGRLDLESSFSGDLDLLQHETHLQLAGAQLVLAGSGEALSGEEPQVRTDFRLTHPNAAGLVGLLTGHGDLLPEGALALEGAAETSPAGFVLDDLHGSAAGIALRGRLERASGAALGLNLALGAVQAEPWLAAFAADWLPGDLVSGDAGQWSRAPLPRSILRGEDFLVGLSFDRLSIGSAHLDEAAVQLERESGALRLSSFEGRLERGRLEAEGRIAALPLERLEAGLSLRGSGVPAALVADWLALTPMIEGDLDLAVSAEASGRSIRDLAGSLMGEGQARGALRFLGLASLNGRADEPDLRTLLREMDAEEVLLFAGLEAREGRIATGDVRLEGSRRRLVIDGTLADVARQFSDFEALLEERDGEGALAVLRVSGPFGEPEMRLRRPGAADAGGLILKRAPEASLEDAAPRRP